MIPIHNTGGSPIIPFREYPVGETTEIDRGQVVKLSGGKVVAAAAGETGAILGVAAESHTGAEDALNGRSNGRIIGVWDSPDTVFQCPAPTITITGGTATTLVATGIATFADDDFNGGFTVLISKAASSTNTDETGTVREITDFTAETKTFTVPSGGTAYAGDVYAIIPPVGFAKGNFDAEGKKLVLTAAAALPVKVIGGDTQNAALRVMAKKHANANGE